ncbi:MAG: cation transporter [Limosilactobacillus gorillae]|jgi:copper chaperone|uniref:heavy-metal-associated domain-containing protein n=1 Tax=Limosilactobacillus gorillae TaxID=1450649 RepID=UPI000A7D3DA3|nr:cation transporter [Limosilactobacillus gorillae]MDO4855783.1 cation transporter [Limosilactobacillus gorillae]
MKKIMMELGGLSCPSCLEKIKTAVEHQAGVSEVKVLFNAGKLKATLDTNQVTAPVLKQVIENLGYQVKNVKEKEVTQ